MGSPALMIERASAAKLRIGVVCVGMDRDSHAALEIMVGDKPGAHVLDNVDSRIAPRELMRMLEPFQYRVCVIDFNGDPDEGCRIAERLRNSCDHSLNLFAAATDSNPEHIIAAMRSGCTEYLVKPFKPETVSDALTHVESRRHIKEESAATGKVITLTGSKGGTGVTSLSVFLSLDLVNRCNQRCLVVDQHVSLGDVSLHLGLSRSQYSFYELVHNTDRLDAELLQGFLLKHESGLHVLDSSEAIDKYPSSNAEAIEHTLSFLAEHYDFVIVDCPPTITEDTAAAIRQSDYLGIVITPEIPAIRNALRMIDYLVDMHFPEECIKVVLNRYSKANALTLQEIESTLHRPVAVKIPSSDKEMSNSVNSGLPTEVNRRSPLLTAFSDWADQLAGREVVAEEKPAGSGRWFGLFGSGA